MTATPEKRARVDWAGLIAGAVKVAIVAFVVLQAKEYHDAGRFDTTGTGADALLIGGGTLVLNLVLGLLKR